MAKIFRRYKSTIYGNYRKAYLTDGLLTGIAVSLVLLLRDCMGDIPMRQPENFVTELVLAIGIFLFGYLYRKELPRGKVTFKELMLLGLGIGVVSAIAFGLWVWLYCGVIDTNMVFYYNRQRVCMMEPAEASAEARAARELVMKYTAGDWGFIAGFRSAVMSIIIAFCAALIYRTEKSPVVEKKEKEK
jgi:hypothetical protein